MSFADGFETHTATFEVTVETREADDGYGGTEEVAETDELEAPVRYEPAGDGFVSESTGEYLRELPRLYADPLEIGDVDESTGEWSTSVAKGDTVTIDTVDGTFQVVTLQAQVLDSQVPEVVRMEVERVGD